MIDDGSPTEVVRETLSRLVAQRSAIEDPRNTEDFLQLVAAASAVRTEANTLLRTTIASARTAGVTWQSIGATLGMTKQAAQKRFAPPAAPSAGELGADERILGPTTAFDEVNELALAGRYGWHSVEAGTNFHRVIRSGTQWEHRRVTLSPSRVRQLRADGWHVISDGFPYAYLKRDTGLPALDEPGSPRLLRGS